MKEISRLREIRRLILRRFRRTQFSRGILQLQKVDECRKKWRDLRDVYVREKREEKKKKSGAAATQKRPWRYYHIMSFLLPFISSRPTSGNMEEERGEGRKDEEDIADVSTEERHDQEMQGGKDMAERHRVESSAEESRMDSLVEDMTGEEGRKRQSTDFTQSRQRRRRVEAASLSCFERKIVEAIESSNHPTPDGSEDPDMQFLQSLLPALKRLDPRSRELTKLKIHQLIFEAEFN
ncbi:uncharacterized protein LOC131537235 isoform X2 [Onychostoma macrolepis]|nr:uncharacterized protein LOC131537235 isoform X2 [Onychostoma macrolepis]